MQHEATLEVNMPNNFTSEQQTAIGKYASLHSNQIAICHFSKKLEVEMKVTLVQTWKRNVFITYVFRSA